MKRLFFMHWSENLVHDREQLTFDVVFDPEKMPALKDHFFSGQCLVPAAMTTELFVQAVAAFRGSDDCFPLYIQDVYFYRAISIPIGETRRVKATCRLQYDNSFNLELTTDLVNKNGIHVRTGVGIASARIHVCSDKQLPKPSVLGRELTAFRFEQNRYYELLNPTHEPLFRSLTGNVFIDPRKETIAAEFNVKTLEKRYSLNPELEFLCSPLALDSVLQVAVLSCIQIESGFASHFFSKLPIFMKDVIIDSPFLQNADYLVKGWVTDRYDSDQHMQLIVSDGDSNLVALFGDVGLRKAPSELRSSVDFDRDFEVYKLRENSNLSP